MERAVAPLADACDWRRTSLAVTCVRVAAVHFVTRWARAGMRKERVEDSRGVKQQPDGECEDGGGGVERRGE